jgi:hypothetical protein
MKGSASGYGVSGAGEYSRVDYQEHRKDTAMSGGIIIAIIAVLAIIAWLFWDRLNASFSAITNPLKGVSDFTTGIVNGAGAMINARQADATSQIVKGATSNTPTVAEARNNLGEYYPIRTLTATDYDNMLKNAGDIPAAIVRLGNVVTPNEVLTAAAGKGAEAANTVNRLGLNNAYWELPDWQRGLVTLGEGIGMTFGVDLIQQGANNAAAADNLKAVDFPSPLGDNIRIGVAASPQPSNGNQNIDQSSDWALYYGGMT